MSCSWNIIFIYNTFISDGITDSISSAIDIKVDASVDNILANVPEEIISAGKTIGIDVQTDIKDQIGDENDAVTSVAVAINNSIARPIISSLIQVILFIIIFILAKLLISWLGKILNIVAKLPIIHSANKLIGGIVGLLRGFILAIVICYALSLIVKFNPSGIFGFDTDVVDKSFIYGFISDIFN